MLFIKLNYIIKLIFFLFLSALDPFLKFYFIILFRKSERNKLVKAINIQCAYLCQSVFDFI